MHVGENPRIGQVWTTDNWLKVNKDPETRPYPNDLAASSACSSLGVDAHALPPGCAAQLCVSLVKLLLCVCSHLWLSLIISWVHTFIVLASMRNTFFRGQRSREKKLLASSPCWSGG